jgi:branched-chain amino acid transport system substrate-binding protein
VQTVAEGLRRTKAGDPLKVAAALRSAPVGTVLGTLTFDNKGDVAGFPVRIYRWHNGTYVETGE